MTSARPYQLSVKPVTKDKCINLLQGLRNFWLQRDDQCTDQLLLCPLSLGCCLGLELMPMTLGGASMAHSGNSTLSNGNLHQRP